MKYVDRSLVGKLAGAAITAWLLQQFGSVQLIVVSLTVSCVVGTFFLLREGINLDNGKPNYRLLSFGLVSTFLMFILGPYVLPSPCISAPCSDNTLSDYATAALNWFR